MTSWLPRREPYELKSAGCTPCAIRYCPAGLLALIDPAGEIWSVVTLLPRKHNTRAPEISPPAAVVLGIFSKYGGGFTYVDFSSPVKVSPPGNFSPCHRASPLRTSLYADVNTSSVMYCFSTSSTSFAVGQMSFRNTGFPLPKPSGSLYTSRSMRPASAHATTSGGDIR